MGLPGSTKTTPESVLIPVKPVCSCGLSYKPANELFLF